MDNPSNCVPARAKPDYPCVWSVVSHLLRPKNADTAFWWQASGSILAEALRQADYPLEEQYACLLFHYKCIVSRLGSRPQLSNVPQMWKSFMTDDFSPIEYSWNWGTGDKPPDVRYSIEAIGSEAGMVGDPFNQKMTLDLVGELRSMLPHADWTWFNILQESFQTTYSSTGTLTSTELPIRHPGYSSPSSLFLAFELRRGRPIVPKAYLVPVRALTTGESPLSVVTQGVESLAANDPVLSGDFSAYANLLHFLDSHPEGRLLSVLFVAVDCVSVSEKSRLKVYFRSPHTSFASVSAILSMGGAFPHLTPCREYDDTATDTNMRDANGKDDILQDFHSLFHSLLSLGPGEEAPVSNKPPPYETEGMLYYFDVAPSSPMPKPKVYIPVKHYARSEKAALLALRKWLEGKGQGKWCRRFEQLVHKVGEGALTYISVGFESGRLNVTTYLGGEIYSRRGEGKEK